MARTKAVDRNRLALVATMMDEHMRTQNKWLLEENKELCRLLATRCRELAHIEEVNANLVAMNAHLQERLLSRRRPRAILVNHHGVQTEFRRNREGIYVEVIDVEIEESPRSVRRRLVYDSSDYDTVDELMGSP